MKKLFSVLFLIFIPLSVLALRPNEKIPARVIEVIDGDTVRVDMSGSIDTVRILGIDTPEKYVSRTGYTECYGEEASVYGKNMLEGKEIILEGDPRQKGRDIYDRLLAHIWIDGKLYGENAIKDGYAFRYTKKATKYQKVFVSAEKDAKKTKIGVWGVCGGKRIPLSKSGSTLSGSSISPILPVNTPSQTNNLTSSVQNTSGSYSCSNVPRYCSGVKSREEAQYYLNTCGATRFDRDNDGIACEDVK